MKDWTVMIYMAGDNNLSADMAYALEEIQETAKENSQKINLLTYCDTAALGAPTFYCDFTEFEKPVWQQSYLVEDKAFKRKGQKEEDGSVYRDENSGAVYSILNFIDWCVNKVEWEENGVPQKGRPAKKYALIFSGHSTAFQNMSFLIDTASNYYMTIPKLRWALMEITKPDGKLLKQNIDLLGFDSCVMGMLELGFGFKKYAKSMVASEGNMPSAGWTYGKILTDLICNSENYDECEIAGRFVTRFIEQQNKFIVGGGSVDLAAWKLENVEDVVVKTDLLAVKFNEILDEPESPFFLPLKYSILTAHWQCQSYMLEQNVDLKDFCCLLTDEIKKFDPMDSTGLLKLCDDVIKAIDECILMCGFSGGNYQYSNGISIFFPWTSMSFNTLAENYADLRVFRKKDQENLVNLENWFKFLDNFVNQLTVRECRKDYPLESEAGLVDKNAVTFVNGFYPSMKNNHFINEKNNHLINEKNNHLINEKNNHLINEKNNHLINEKNNHLINEKNNHLINEKNNHLINEKGSLLSLLIQFKNTQSPWYISGFTKNVSAEKEKKLTAEKE